MNKTSTLIKLIGPAALAAVLAGQAALPFSAFAASTQPGSAIVTAQAGSKNGSNPDGGGCDKPGDTKCGAGHTQDDGHDYNNGLGNDPTKCDDAKGDTQRAKPINCGQSGENQNIPFVPMAAAYPALAGAAFVTGFGVRKWRKSRKTEQSDDQAA